MIELENTSHNKNSQVERTSLNTRKPELIWAFIVMVLLSLLFTWPMVQNINKMIYGYAGDSTGSIYDLWYLHNHGLNLFGTSSNSLRGFPFGYETSNWPQLTSSLLQVFAWCMMLVLSEVVAYNFLILSGLFLTGFSMYYVSRRLGFSVGTSYFAGIALMFFPFQQLAATSWYSQVHLEMLPIVLLNCVLFFRNQKIRHLIGLISFSFLSFLTNAYVGLFAFSIVGASLILMKMEILKKVFTSLVRRRFIFLVTLISLSLASLVIIKLRSLGLTSVERNSVELKIYGLRISDLVKPTSVNPFFNWLYGDSRKIDHHGSNLIETAQYLTLTVIGLSLIGCFQALFKTKNYFLLRISLGLILVGYLMGTSQGWKFGDINIKSPASYLFQIAPFWRVYSRYGVLVFLGALLLALIAVEEFAHILRSKILVIIFVGSLAGSFFVESWSPLPGRTTEFEEPPHIQIISREPGPVAFFPIVADSHSHSYEQRFWQRKFSSPMLNGGPSNSQAVGLQRSLGNISNPKIANSLRLLNINKVVLDKQIYKEITGNEPVIKDTNLIPVYSDQRYSVFRISKDLDKASGLGWFMGDRYADEYRNDGNSWRWLGRNARLSIYVTQTGCYAIRHHMVSSIGQKSVYLRKIDFATNHEFATFSDEFWNVKLSPGINQYAIDLDKSVFRLPSPDGRVVSKYAGDVTIKQLKNEQCD